MKKQREWITIQDHITYHLGRSYGAIKERRPAADAGGPLALLQEAMKLGVYMALQQGCSFQIETVVFQSELPQSDQQGDIRENSHIGFSTYR